MHTGHAARRTLAVALALSFVASIPAYGAPRRPERGARRAAEVSAAAVVGAGPHFGNPGAIAVEASGSYAVADMNWRTLLRVNHLTAERAPIGPPVLSEGNRRPTAIALQESGALMAGETTGSGDPGLDATLARYGAQGERTVVSGDGRGSGPTLIAPSGLARETSGAWLVADRGRATVFRIDPATGNRAVVSGCVLHPPNDCTAPMVGGGPPLTSPAGLALDGTGTLVVAQPGLLLRVDPGSGERTPVSGGGVGDGPALGAPAAIAVEASGAVLWADTTSRSLLRIDPSTGARQVVSGPTTGSGAPFKSFSGLAIGQEVVGLVVDAVQGLVLKVDLSNGDRTPFSGGPMSAGDALGCVSGLAVEASGALVASDRCGAAVVRVDPAGGDRTLLSGATRGAGPDLDSPLDITREPSGSLVIVDRGKLLRVDAGTGDRAFFVGGGDDLLSPVKVATESGDLVAFANGVQRCIGVGPPIFCWHTGKGVFRVDGATGEVAVVSGGGVSGKKRGRGPGWGAALRDIALQPDGTIFTALEDRIFRVDPTSGDRVNVVRFNCCGFAFGAPHGIAVEPAGTLAVTNRVILVRLDPSTRHYTLLSGWQRTQDLNRTRGEGPDFPVLTAVAVEAGGALIVASEHPALPGAAAIWRVDPVTGDRSYLSR